MKELKEKFDSYIDKTYDIKEAVKRQNINCDDLMKLRKKLLDVPCVPKLLYDKFVSYFVIC